jgi:hypothetical protein
MPRPSLEEIVAGAHGALVEGERITEYGPCWAAQLRHRVPLVLTRRRQYLIVLTDRRLLLFHRRRRHALAPDDLVLGKRYDSFQLDRVHRSRPLMQLLVTGTGGTRMVLEFRPGRRRVASSRTTSTRRSPRRPRRRPRPRSPALTPTTT